MNSSVSGWLVAASPQVVCAVHSGYWIARRLTRETNAGSWPTKNIMVATSIKKMRLRMTMRARAADRISFHFHSTFFLPVALHGRGHESNLYHWFFVMSNNNNAMSLCRKPHTGCSISSRTMVGLTLIFAVPLSAWFCLGRWFFWQKRPSNWARWWNIPHLSQPYPSPRADGTRCSVYPTKERARERVQCSEALLRR